MGVAAATAMDIMAAMAMGGSTLTASCCRCNSSSSSSSSSAASSKLLRVVRFPSRHQTHALLPALKSNGLPLKLRYNCSVPLIQLNGRQTRLVAAALNGNAGDKEEDVSDAERLLQQQKQLELAERIASGEFTVLPRKDRTQKIRRALANAGPVGRILANKLVHWEMQQRVEDALKMPETRGDVKAVVGEPFFLPLYKLFRIYGGVFRLTFGPKVC
jgi:hypothetical protein